MSIKAMDWAWDLCNIPSTVKFVLVALADHSDPTGLCWPGQEGIAEKCGLSRQTVNKSIQYLKSAGFLTIENRFDGKGRALPNYYRLSLKQGGGVNQSDTGRVNVGDTGVNQSDSIENRQEEPSVREPSNTHTPRSQNPQPDSGPSPDEWAESPWLRQFLQQQTAINGDRLPRLMNYEFWADLSEAINGIDPPLLTREFAKMGMWLRDNPARAPTVKGIRRFVAGWFERAYERERRIPNGTTGQTQRRYHQPGLR